MWLKLTPAVEIQWWVLMQSILVQQTVKLVKLSSLCNVMRAHHCITTVINFESTKFCHNLFHDPTFPNINFNHIFQLTSLFDRHLVIRKYYSINIWWLNAIIIRYMFGDCRKNNGLMSKIVRKGLLVGEERIGWLEKSLLEVLEKKTLIPQPK